MKDVFQVILADRNVSELLPALADVEPDTIAQYAIKLTDEDSHSVVDWLTRSLRRLGVRSTLYAGAIFYVARELDEAFCGNATLQMLYEEFGISRTQAYRAIQVFEVFNPIFQENSKLLDLFVSESLKVLAEDQTKAEARIEALRQAKTGTKISIRIARDLQNQFAESPEAGIDSEQCETQVASSRGNRNMKPKTEAQRPVEKLTKAEPSEANLFPGTIVEQRAEAMPDAILYEGYGFRLVIEPELANQSGGELDKIVEGLEQFLKQLRSQVNVDVPKDEVQS